VLRPSLESRRRDHDAKNVGVTFLSASVRLPIRLTCSLLTFSRFYAITMVLLVAYQPVFHVQYPEDITLLIKRSLSILSLWGNVPFMREPLTRIHCFADEVGWSHELSPGLGLLGSY
jgi:hypothetical protein